MNPFHRRRGFVAPIAIEVLILYVTAGSRDGCHSAVGVCGGWQGMTFRGAAGSS
jgi:hypothetical protein